MSSTTESTVTVAYPGREGAHSAAAADTLFGGGEELRALPSFQAVADAVAGVGGRLRRAADRELALGPGRRDARPALRLAALDRRRGRCSRSATACSRPRRYALEDIRLVHSHPVALDQCRQLLARMPNAQAVAAPTTADAANAVAEKGDPTEAAIASERAAQLYGLHVVAADVGDHPEAYTRFVAVATYTRPRPQRPRLPHGVLVRHRPHAREPPARARAVRPARREPRAARLAPDPRLAVALPLRRRARRASARSRVGEALREVRATARRLTVFGCYPAGALSPTPLKNV